MNNQTKETDRLAQLFQWQAELNKRIGFDANALRDNFDPKLAGEWLNNYLAAMSNELEELRDCMFWKHWCKEAKEGRRFEIHDLQNARVEVTDMLFFWISLALSLGINADDAFRLYQQKLGINHTRQDDNYSMANKTEDDNKNIK